MTTWRIAVGSTRRPKLNAVSEALLGFGPLLGGDIILKTCGYEVESGVNHTPLCRDELMRGARQRAEAVAKLVYSLREEAKYFVGLEGGLDVVPENSRDRVFLESWAYVSDGRHGYFGCSGSVELPAALVEAVLVRGKELALAVDELAGTEGVRDAQGAWGVLTRNRITRQESFHRAVVAAFAPFYNRKLYGASTAATA
jgi:inosine/xanthosine triphosphatase